MNSATSVSHFHFGADCRLVRGARRAALYDLDSGEIYSLDPAAARVVELCDTGTPLPAIAAAVPEVPPGEIFDFLHRAADAGLGRFTDAAEHPAKNTVEAPPVRLDYLWLELREDCNLRCRHCYCTSQPASAPVERMTHADWRRVLEEGAELGCREVQFIGGEPFLYGEGLFDLATHARSLGYRRIEIFSNLTVLKDEWIDRIVELELKIACSVYSARPEVHDLVTTQPGSFARTLKGVQRLKERGVQPRFALTVMKQNQDYVEETLEFFKALGNPAPSFDLVRPSGRGNDAEIHPDKISRKRRYRTRAQFMRTDRATFERRYSGNSCWQGKLAVSSSGDVHACIMQRDGEAGNVRKASLRAVVEGGLRPYWGLSFDQIEVCRDCEYRYACQDCRPVVYGSTGALTAKSLHCSYDPYAGEWKDLDEAAGALASPPQALSSEERS